MYVIRMQVDLNGKDWSQRREEVSGLSPGHATIRDQGEERGGGEEKGWEDGCGRKRSEKGWFLKARCGNAPSQS